MIVYYGSLLAVKVMVIMVMGVVVYSRMHIGCVPPVLANSMRLLRLSKE